MSLYLLVDPISASEIGHTLQRQADTLAKDHFYQTDLEESWRLEQLAGAIRPQSNGGRAVLVHYPVQAIVELEQLRSALRGHDDGVVAAVRDWFESPEGYAAAVRSGKYRQIVCALGRAAGVKDGPPFEYSDIFSVEGESPFPIDLLRQFECVPATPPDAGRIAETMQRRFARPVREPAGVRIALLRVGRPRKLIIPEAFEIYGWRIVGKGPAHV